MNINRSLILGVIASSIPLFTNYSFNTVYDTQELFNVSVKNIHKHQPSWIKKMHILKYLMQYEELKNFILYVDQTFDKSLNKSEVYNRLEMVLQYNIMLKERSLNKKVRDSIEDWNKDITVYKKAIIRHLK